MKEYVIWKKKKKKSLIVYIYSATFRIKIFHGDIFISFKKKKNQCSTLLNPSPGRNDN